MATHSSVLAWRIPGTGKPGGPLSMGSQSRTRLKRFSSSSSSRTYRARSVFHWYDYLAAVFVPSLGTTDVILQVDTLIGFTRFSKSYFSS